MRYTVVTAHGSRLRVVSRTNSRREAERAMYRNGGLTVVQTRDGRILASTVARSFG